jgi:integrase
MTEDFSNCGGSQDGIRFHNCRIPSARPALRISEVERGELVRPAKITLAELGQQYMDYARANKRSWLRDQRILVHLNNAFGNMLLPDITALPKNPVKGIRFLDENNLEFRTLQEIEEAALLLCCSPYLQDLVTFAINTGLRLGDILNLKWEEVDLERGIINTVVRKRRRMLELPRNEKGTVHRQGLARDQERRSRVLQPGDWYPMEGPVVGLEESLPQGWASRRDVAHLPPCVRIEA